MFIWTPVSYTLFDDMKKIENMPDPATLDQVELRKSQSDPEYMVRKYLAEPDDVVTSEIITHPLGTEIHIRVTEPSGKWSKFKFLRLTPREL